MGYQVGKKHSFLSFLKTILHCLLDVAPAGFMCRVYVVVSLFSCDGFQKDANLNPTMFFVFSCNLGTDERIGEARGAG